MSDRILISIFCLFFLVNCLSAEEQVVLDRCAFMGRVDDSDKKCYKFSFPGVSVKMSFKGSERVSVLLSDTLRGEREQSNYFYLFVDGGLVRKFSVDTIMKPMLLVEGLSKGKHTIELVKLTETTVALSQFGGFLIDEKAKVLKSTYSAPLTIEFIGNSITCGFGNEVSNDPPLPGFTSVNENNYEAWGAIVARELSANYRCTACSGIGIRHNFDGDSLYTMPRLYPNILLWDPSKKIDSQLSETDLVVINLGTNDFSYETNSGHKVDSVDFVGGYIDFINDLRRYYPRATFVCVVGPMVNDSYPVGAFHWTRLQRYVSAVVEHCQKSGDKKIYYFKHEPQTAPYGESYHPNKSTHARMAKNFAAFLRTLSISQ